MTKVIRKTISCKNCLFYEKNFLGVEYCSKYLELLEGNYVICEDFELIEEREKEKVKRVKIDVY